MYEFVYSERLYRYACGGVSGLIGATIYEQRPCRICVHSRNISLDLLSTCVYTRVRGRACGCVQCVVRSQAAAIGTTAVRSPGDTDVACFLKSRCIVIGLRHDREVWVDSAYRSNG